MIRQDIENLNFKELNDLEKQEYLSILTLNIRKVTLQLMNSGNTQLATLFTVGTTLATLNPTRLYDLVLYAARLHETSQLELATLKKTMEIEAVEKDEPKVEDDFPELDTEKVS